MVTFPRNWLLLLYKLPAAPSAPRVYIWRKLKRLGALLVLDSTWVLPDTPRTLEQFQWLATEIIEMGGEALLWKSHPALVGHEEDLYQQFIAQLDDGYAILLADLQQPDPDFEHISRQYQQLKNRDYFNSEMGVQVREALIARRGENT
jgi:hypothetical protein